MMKRRDAIMRYKKQDLSLDCVRYWIGGVAVSGDDDANAPAVHEDAAVDSTLERYGCIVTGLRGTEASRLDIDCVRVEITCLGFRIKGLHGDNRLDTDEIRWGSFETQMQHFGFLPPPQEKQHDVTG